jgi:isoquinoline 1-oxidoreductase beta subunit
MLTAVVAHPPVYGSKIQSVDDAAAKAIKGVRAVLRVPSVWGASWLRCWPMVTGQPSRARCPENPVGQRAVGKVDSARQLAQYRELAKKPGALKFDADVSALSGAVHKISAEYVFPYLAHTPMEPLNCTVRVTGAGKDARLSFGWARRLRAGKLQRLRACLAWHLRMFESMFRWQGRFRPPRQPAQ